MREAVIARRPVRKLSQLFRMEKMVVGPGTVNERIIGIFIRGVSQK